jgi:DNA-binding winged helix-turn-helix (wHTH) protein
VTPLPRAAWGRRARGLDFPTPAGIELLQSSKELLAMQNGGKKKPEIVFRFNAFTLRQDGGGLFRQDEWVPLSRKPYEVLLYLVRNRARAVPRDELLREIWQGARDLNVLEQCVHELRSRLGDHPRNPAYIQTVYGVGYRFIAPVEELAEPPRGMADPPAQTSGSAERVPAGWSARLWVRTAAVLLLLVAAGAAAWLAHSRNSGAVAVRVLLSGPDIVAMDSTGRVLWKYSMPAPARTLTPEETERRVWFLDQSDRTGRRQVLVAVPSRVGTAGALAHEVLCFGPAGELLWQYTPKLRLEFPARQFDGGWEIQKVVPAGNTVWLAVKHEIWWPSFVVAVRDGRPQVVFVNSGTIFDLAAGRPGGEELLAVSAVNNDYGAAALAVLKSPYQPASSPHPANSPYRCLNCAATAPPLYAIFPGTDLSRAKNKPYGIGAAVRFSGSLLEVEVRETEDAYSFYQFDSRLMPASFAVSDGYAGEHDALFRQRVLDHPASICPDLTRPRHVRAMRGGAWEDYFVKRVADSRLRGRVE